MSMRQILMILGFWLMVSVASAQGKEKEINPVSPSKSRDKVSTPSASSNSSGDMRQLSDYQLELKASKGDAQAYYTLGRRWVLKGDSVSLVKGEKYLKEAARRGSRDAQVFLKNHHF